MTTVGYTVRKGDTFSSIARRNQTSVGSLQKANAGVRNINKISIGQKLNLPSRADTFEQMPSKPNPGKAPTGAVTPGKAAAPSSAPGKVSNSGATKGEAAARQAAKETTAAAGVPPKWAENKSLWELLRGENRGFDSTKHNVGTKGHKASSAYGLFQFLDKTWGTVGATKTSDTNKQFVAGYKYIKNVYGTPERALQKWQSRSPHWY